MSKIVPKKCHVREVMLYHFNSKKSAAESHRMLVETYADNAPSERTCRYWFSRFSEGNFDLSDQKRENRPKKFEDTDLQVLLDEDNTQSQEMLAVQLGVSRPAISKRLHAMGKIQKIGKWGKRVGNRDNAPSHTSTFVRNYLEALNWEVLPHPPYSPDFAPSDYHLFSSMSHALAEQHFNSYEDVRKWLDDWFASKTDAFYWQGIHNLPERWEECVASEGQYFE